MCIRDRLRTDKERAETQLAQEQHKLEPVSYTQLDVYKRQLLHRFSDLLHAEGQGCHPNEVPEKVCRRAASQDGKVIFVAVYRVNKNRGYTVMANFHLRDKSLSLKAVGLLSKMLSFNDGWKFSTKGLSAICKEGPDAILSALRELEKHGYLVRHRQSCLLYTSRCV